MESAETHPAPHAGELRGVEERKELVEQLKKGKRFVTGVRKAYLGSVFETGPAVHYTDEHIVTNGQAAARDLLVGVSVF